VLLTLDHCVRRAGPNRENQLNFRHASVQTRPDNSDAYQAQPWWAEDWPALPRVKNSLQDGLQRRHNVEPFEPSGADVAQSTIAPHRGLSGSMALVEVQGSRRFNDMPTNA